MSKKKSILTSKVVFTNHMPRIGVLNGNGDSTGCVRGGREAYTIILFFFAYIYVLSALFYDCFFVVIEAFFYIVGVIYILSVGNGT